MQKRYIVLLGVALCALILLGTVLVLQHREQTASDTGGGTATEITAQQVARHNAADSCWVIIGQKVFDITPYIAKGAPVVQLGDKCGSTVTDYLGSLEQKQQTKARDALETYYIGILVPN